MWKKNILKSVLKTTDTASRYLGVHEFVATVCDVPRLGPVVFTDGARNIATPCVVAW